MAEVLYFSDEEFENMLDWWFPESAVVASLILAVLNISFSFCVASLLPVGLTLASPGADESRE